MSTSINYDEEAKGRYDWVEKTGGVAANGLTIRDYFAAKALGALVSTVSYKEWGGIADAAYALADSMIKKRGE